MKQLSTIQVVDVRAQLSVIKTVWQNGKQVPHSLNGWLQPKKTGYTLHYAGVKTKHRNRAELLETLKGFRTSHIQRIGGDGIQYHFSIAGDGDILQTRDLDQGLWSCANYEGNRDHIHINLPLGPGEHPTTAMWAAFERLVDALIREFGWKEGRAVGKGHREWPKYELINGKYIQVPNSACPGDVLMAKLDAFRKTKSAPIVESTKGIADLSGRVFRCGQGFYDLYHNNGGLLVFGQPLSDEYTERDQDGEVCAYMDFENAVFKYKPSLPAPWNCRPILLSEAVWRYQQRRG